MANMKLLATFLLLVYLRCAFAEESVYSTKYDGVDLDEILTNDRLLNSYVNCLLNNGPCSPDAKELKNNLPDAVENDCNKCSDRQREGADKVLDFIIDHRPADWEKLEKMYNPDGSYKKKYLERKKYQNKSGGSAEVDKESKETNGDPTQE